MYSKTLRKFILFFISLFFAFTAVTLRAEVSLPGLFSDGMVMQQGALAPVWGRAGPGEKVTVEFRGQTAPAYADNDGKWMVRIESLEAGGPFELKVSGENTILIKDVLVGEVWLCSGQSNMAMEVRRCLNAEEEIASALFPQIRQFQVKRGKAEKPRERLMPTEGQNRLNRWVPAGPETVGHFSGVGYFFARCLHSKLKVPVGLIHSSWGGTTAEAWTSLPALEKDPALRSILTNWPGYNDDEEWLGEMYVKFLEEIEKAKEKGETKPLYFNQPSVLFNAMIAPLIPFCIQGVIWYQGESNAFRAYQYRDLFPAMIRNWRDLWGQGDFPFLFVQLADFESGAGNWPELREAQSMALELPNTGQAVAVDVGNPDDVHPKNKQEVGRRLALAARAIVYGEKIVYSGPVYSGMKIVSGRCVLSFTHPGEGLTASGSAKELKGFTIAGKDRLFTKARAVIEGNTVVVWSPDVKDPAAVRYAWADNPAGANLYNLVRGKPGLPASPFRTDQWPGITAGRR